MVYACSTFVVHARSPDQVDDEPTLCLVAVDDEERGASVSRFGVAESHTEPHAPYARALCLEWPSAISMDPGIASLLPRPR